MKAFNVRGDGYAGFRSPDDVVDDLTLSSDEKHETLQHWQQSLIRLARFAPSNGRETYENLTIELAAAIERVDSARSSAPIINNRPRRMSRG